MISNNILICGYLPRGGSIFGTHSIGGPTPVKPIYRKLSGEPISLSVSISCSKLFHHDS